MKIVELPIERLVVDATVHARSGVQSKTVRRYQQILQSGAKLPPVVGFQDTPDGPCWLADGFHRYYAARREGRASIPVEICPGGQREAYLHACGANASHGLPRTRNDRWRSIVAAMHVPELVEKDDTWLAKNCCVSRTLIRQVREDCRDEETLLEAFRSRGSKAACQPKSSAAKRTLAETPSPEPSPAAAATTPASPAGDATERLIARAFRAVRTAGKALAAAEKAYPEAARTEASVELMEARNLIEDQLTPEEREKLGLAGVEVSKVREAQRAMRELWEEETKVLPATKRAAMLPSVQPATKRPADFANLERSAPAVQPATKRAALHPAPAEPSPHSDPSGSLPLVGRAGEGVRRLSNLQPSAPPHRNLNLEQSARSTNLEQSVPFNLEQSAPAVQSPTKRAALHPAPAEPSPHSDPSGSLPLVGRVGEGVRRLSNLQPSAPPHRNLEPSAPEVQPRTKRAADEEGIHR